MARALIVGCGCRGRTLGRRLAAADWQVRGTTRSPGAAADISAAGLEPALADPDRPGEILDRVADVTLIFWLLGSAVGEPEAVAAIHGPRLERLLEKLVDSPVRGQALVWLTQHGFEDPSTLPPDVLAAMMVSTFAITLDHEGGEALVAQLTDLGTGVEQIRWIDSLERVHEPRVNDLLAAIGRSHPDHAVAKAARTTLFKRKGLRLH